MATKWKAKGTAPLTVRVRVRVRVLARVLLLAQAMPTCVEGTRRAQCLCISASQGESGRVSASQLELNAPC